MVKKSVVGFGLLLLLMVQCLSAADVTEPSEQFDLGYGYYTGGDLDQNHALAFEWFHKSAQQGHVRAQYYTGLMYELGQGVNADFIKAFAWYLIAAAQGHQSGKSNMRALIKELTPEQLAQANAEAARIWEKIN